MKIGLGIGLVGLAVVCAYLYSYRQKMTRPMSVQQKKEIADRTQAEHLIRNKSIRLPYRLFVPDTKDNSERLPLVLYLHGAGGRGDDNSAQLDNIVEFLTSDAFQQEFKSFVLVPQCPEGHQWVDIKNETRPYRNYNQNNISESVYLAMVMEVLSEITDSNKIDPDRLYVMGFSMGATGTWDIVTRHPDKFAAAIILNGRSDPSQARRISELPLWVFHGKFDRVSPISNAREMIDQLRKFDSKVVFKELFWGHGITKVALKGYESFRWLFSHRISR